MAQSELALDIVALGEPMIEFNQAQANAPNAYLQGFGGDTSNMAIAAARLGARVGYVTRLGDDAFGRLFRELWTAEGVDIRGVATDVVEASARAFLNAVNKIVRLRERGDVREVVGGP